MSAPALKAENIATTPIMEVRNLTKYFPVGARVPWRKQTVIKAVEDVNFALYPGKITALVGESGSGKSTVARLLARLYQPTSGTILFRDKDVAHTRSAHALREYRGEVQMIFQDPFASLNPVKRVRHHLVRPLLIHDVVPKRQVDERIHELLYTVGLVPPAEFALKYPHQLSGGQRQRVAVARALAVEPDVLLADEPISMLDVSIRIGILNLMQELKRQRDIAFLYITHDIASARYIADEVLVMYKGHVVEKGETDLVLQTPLHPYTRLLLSAVPNPEAGLRQERVEAREDREIEDPACSTLLPPGAQPIGQATGQASLVEVEPDHWVRCY